MMRSQRGAVLAIALTLTLTPFAVAAVESEVVPPLGPFNAAVQPEIVPPPSRDVTPRGVTPAPYGSGPLIREAAPPLPPAPPLRPAPPRWHRFILPVTIDAATLIAPDRTIRLAGVVALARATTCKSSYFGDWPCGRAALEALRHFLLGRPVECSYLNADQSSPLVAPCRVGRTDLAAWLLAEGWVKAAVDASAEYRQAEETARCARRGFWRGSSRPANCPTPVATAP